MEHCVEKMSNLNYIIFLLALLPFIGVVSVVVSSLLVINLDKNMIENLKKEEEDLKQKEKVEVKYNDKYVLSDDDVDIAFEYLENKNFDNICLMEKTPKGIVLMKYNKEDELWDYWADRHYKNNISYDDLCTVCRKFCKIYKCGDLYIDKKLELEKLKILNEQKEMEKHDKKEEKDEDSDDDVFVKNVSSLKSDKEEIINVKSNKFKYRGDISSCNDLNKKIEKKQEENKNVSWSMWKTLGN